MLAAVPEEKLELWSFLGSCFVSCLTDDDAGEDGLFELEAVAAELLFSKEAGAPILASTST